VCKDEAHCGKPANHEVSLCEHYGRHVLTLACGWCIWRTGATHTAACVVLLSIQVGVKCAIPELPALLLSSLTYVMTTPSLCCMPSLQEEAGSVLQTKLGNTMSWKHVRMHTWNRHTVLLLC
jgi:hypothetical protein